MWRREHIPPPFSIEDQMATARDIIIGAMKLLNVLEANASPTAEEADDALVMLNDMCNAWTNDDLHTGFSTMDFDDEMPLAESHIGGVKAMLAVYMSDEYARDVSQNLVMRAKQAKALLRAEYLPRETLKMDDALLYMPSQRRC
jgi:hypothetical protein